MKFESINKRFTEIVSEYIAKGYIINAGTMSGSQGETAKVDLTNGSEIIRVVLDRFSDHGDYWLEGLKITVGRSTDQVKPNSTYDWTIWNNHLEVIGEERYYMVGDRSSREAFYGTLDEATAAAEKRRARRRLQGDWGSQREDITERAMPVALRIIRNRLGVTRVVRNKVKVTRCEGRYTVKYGHHTFRVG